MNTRIVVDNPTSWFMPSARRLVRRLGRHGKSALVERAEEIPEGNGIAFLLSCERPVPAAILARSLNTVVVHASALPRGRGMSPLAWQVLEGQNEITMSLFEAVEEVDAGPIYLSERVSFGGHELLPEMQAILGRTIVDMCVRFVDAHDALLRTLTAQTGQATYYRRRTPADSRLDPDRTIAEQFDLLRVVDNRRYPAFFELRGRRYILSIKPASD